MKKHSLAAIVLMAVIPPAAHTQTTSAAVRPVLLRLKFTPGQALYYTTTLDVTGAASAGRPGGGKPTRMLTRMLMHQRVRSVRASDGAATVEVGVDTISMAVDGRTVPVPPALLAQSKTLGTMTILPNGKVLSFVRPAGQRLLPTLPGSDLSHTNPMGSMGYFPDTAVRAGDTWESRIPSASTAVQAVARFTLSGVDTAGGRRVALIDFTTSGATGAAPAEIRQSLHGKGRLRFDIDAGAVTDQSSASSLTMTFPGGPTRDEDHAEERRTLTRVPAPH